MDQMDQDKQPSAQASLPGQAEIAAIALSLRVPPFWRDKSRLWFMSFEAATAELKKGQEQLAQMVIAQLEKQDIEQVSDILCNPPPNDLYNALKNRLISVYEESDSRQLKKLLSEIELGDQKPTQLLRRMKFLAGDKVPESTLRLLWTNHLPPNVQSVLAVSDSFTSKTTLDELALIADKMMESNPTSQISVVEAATSSTPSTDMQFLIKEIGRMSLEIAALKTAHCNHGTRRPPFRRNRSAYRGHSRSRSRSLTPSPYCYYHRKFGSAARHCTTPCTYKNESQKSEN